MQQLHPRVYEHTQAEGTKVPWDVGFAQPAIEEVSSRFRGKVLDAGCGLGDNTRWLGTLPTVSAAVGVDISRAAIEEARMRLERDEERGERVAQPPVEFRVASLDAPPPAGEEGEFDAVLDAGVYHCVEDQAKYLEAMTTRVKPGGVAVALEFSDANPDSAAEHGTRANAPRQADASSLARAVPGPRRMSKEALRSGWEAAGWDVERIDDVRFMTRPTPQLGTSAAALRLIATRKPRA